MRPERINELLATCGNSWLGGQRDLVRAAIARAAEEERHLATIRFLSPEACTCDICRRVHEHIEAERLAL